MKFCYRSINLIFLFLFVVIELSAQENPASAEAYTKGMQHFRNARFKESIQSFDTAIKADSTNYNAWVKGYTTLKY